MKIRSILALLVLAILPSVKAQEQFYSTVDVTANILEIAYDRKLVSTLNGSIIVAGVRGGNPSGYGGWTSQYGYTYGEHYDILWAKMNKTVNCGGQEISDFVVLPILLSPMPSNYTSSFPNIPWIATADPDDSYFRTKELFSNAYLNNLQVKFTRIMCGNPQLHPIKNQLVPVAYIQGQKYFKIIPKKTDNSTNNSAWVNGVQVTPTNSQPTNAVVTNWNFTVPAAGNYDVYVHWVSNKNQVANIAYAVDGQALKSAALDQNINAGIWTKLIKNTQYSVGEHSIKISVDANANYVVDGVRAEKSAQ